MPRTSTTSGKKILVTKVEIATDPIIEIFSVEIGDSKSTWMETVPSQEALSWFLRGVSAGASQYGNTIVSLPEIPRQSVPLKEHLTK